MRNNSVEIALGSVETSTKTAISRWLSNSPRRPPSAALSGSGVDARHSHGTGSGVDARHSHGTHAARVVHLCPPGRSKHSCACARPRATRQYRARVCARRAHAGTARAARLPADVCAQVLPPAGGSSGGGRSVGPPPPAVLCAAEGAGRGCGLNAARRRPSDRPVRAPRPHKVNAAGPHTVRRARARPPRGRTQLERMGACNRPNFQNRFAT